MRATDTLAGSALILAKKARELKLNGYHQVALAGQSFGGFLSLMAADASDDVDAVIVTAPAAFGDYSSFYNSWRANATRLYPLLEKVRRAHVMMFYFHGDDFDPGGRGEHSRDILATRRLDYAIVDQPPYLTGHWAASTPLFARLYSACILAFLANHLERNASCDAGADDALWAGTSVKHQVAAAAPSALMQAPAP
jgi:pimeloyl-ACP methyl ester carboxylesterase